MLRFLPDFSNFLWLHFSNSRRIVGKVSRGGRVSIRRKTSKSFGFFCLKHIFDMYSSFSQLLEWSMRVFNSLMFQKQSEFLHSRLQRSHHFSKTERWFVSLCILRYSKLRTVWQQAICFKKNIRTRTRPATHNIIHCGKPDIHSYGLWALRNISNREVLTYYCSG